MESTLFHTIDWLIVDSTIERTATDTTTRVRFIRATKAQQSTYEATETRTQTDTTAATVEEKAITPIAAESKKNGVAWLCPQVRTALWIFFLLIFVVLVCFIKNFLFLHRK